MSKSKRMSKQQADMAEKVIWGLRAFLKLLKAGAVDSSDPNVKKLMAVAAEWNRHHQR